MVSWTLLYVQPGSRGTRHISNTKSPTNVSDVCVYILLACALVLGVCMRTVCSGMCWLLVHTCYVFMYVEAEKPQPQL